MIRKATYSDLNAVEQIYAHIHEQEQLKKMCTGWIPNVYPIRATAEKALARGDLFVYTQDDTIHGSAIINQIQVDVYADCDWNYKASDHEVMVLHTLVVDPSSVGKGIGKEFVRFYEDCAAKAGCRVLRMDTNAKNIVARNLYAKLGYTEAGIIPCVFNGIPDVQLVLLEKPVISNQGQ